ncbi:MAG: hypothetical protein IPN78_19340 [Candidatus Accumulibacter sp.]|nr:hypothetical protein [Candidatus Accumulibacter propinquus]
MSDISAIVCRVSRQGGGRQRPDAAAPGPPADQPLQSAGGDPRRPDLPAAPDAAADRRRRRPAQAAVGAARRHPEAPSAPRVSSATCRTTFACSSRKTPGSPPASWRARRATYLRVVRGWAFDAESCEAAVLKGWVESRFGLCPRHHGGSAARTGQRAALRATSRVARRACRDQRPGGTTRPAVCLQPVRTGAAVSAPQPPALYRGVNRLAEHET